MTDNRPKEIKDLSKDQDLIIEAIEAHEKKINFLMGRIGLLEKRMDTVFKVTKVLTYNFKKLEKELNLLIKRGEPIYGDD